jgi:hypothetical protein
MDKALARALMGLTVFLLAATDVEAAHRHSHILGPDCRSVYGHAQSCKNGQCTTPYCEVTTQRVPNDVTEEHPFFPAQKGWTISSSAHAVCTPSWVQATGWIHVDGTGGNGTQAFFHAQASGPHGFPPTVTSGGVGGTCVTAASPTGG